MTQPQNHAVSPLVLVEEFHLTYGQKVRMTPNMNIPERELRIALIAEEIRELKEAAAAKDFIEVVDALADILYVTYGAAIAHGINIDHAMGLEDNISPAYNIKSALETDGTPIPNQPFYSSLMLMKNIPAIENAFQEYELGSNNLNKEILVSALIKIIFTTYALAFKLGVNIDDVLQEVQHSNRTKLGLDGKPIYSETGKVLKGPNFEQPKIGEKLKQQGWVE